MNRSRVTGDLASHGNIFVDIANDRVGIGSTIPGEKLSLPDSAKIALGNSADLSIYHDGSTSYLVDSGTGALQIQASTLFIKNAAGNENMIQAHQNGAVNLYYDNSKKLETTSSGAKITGTATATGSLIVGSGNNFQVTRSSGNTEIQNYSGTLLLANASSNSNNVFIRGRADENSIVCIPDGAVELYHNNSKKLETTSTGVNVTGSITGVVSAANTNLLHYTANMGSNNNRTFIIKSPVADSTASPFTFNTANAFEFLVDSARTLFIHESGRIDLHHDGSTDAKLSTSSSGVNISGGISITNTAPSLAFVDSNNNNDFTQYLDAGVFHIRDTTLSQNRFSIASDGTITVQQNLDVGVDLDVTDDITLGGEFNMLGSSDNNKYFDARIGSSYKLIFRSSSGGAGNLVTMLQLGTTGSSLVGNFALGDSSDSSSAAGPEFTLNRNSSSPANADYLGQIKFAGRSSTGVQRNYAKITGKILDVTNGAEDGILEFAHIKNGSQVITGRWRSDSLQLLNDTSLTVAGTFEVTGTSSLGNTVSIDTTQNEKLVLRGSSNPYVRFKQGTTDKAYIQWDSGNARFIFVNQASSEELQIGSGVNGLIFRAESTNYTVWHGGNDGTGSGLDADLLDGVQGSSFLRSDANDTASGDITFSGGAGAITLAAESDIRFTNSSNWTGDVTGKIQLYNNTFYISGGTGGIIFREGGSSRWRIDGSGHFIPINGDGLLDIGTNTVRVRNGYFDTLYGDGSNITAVDADTVDGFQTSQSGGANKVLVSGSNNYLILDSWLRVSHGTGIFVSSGQHLFSGNNGSWKSWYNQSDDGTACGIGLRNNSGTDLAWVYANSTQAGFLNPTTEDWRFRVQTTGITKLNSHGAQLVNGNVNQNLKYIAGANSTDIGISGYNSGGTWKFQLYGATNYYGFLNANWGGWDIRKNIGGELQISQGGSLRTVWHNANDGSGSGLDADLLDGVQGSSYLRSDADDTMSEKLTFTQNGQTEFLKTPGNVTMHSVNSGDNALILRNLGQLRFEDGSNWNYNEWAGIKFVTSSDVMYIGGPASSQFTNNGGAANINVNFVGLNNNGLQKDGSQIWHAGNDGSGSGLDADTVDGLHASSFCRTDTTFTFNASGNDINLDYDNVRNIVRIQKQGVEKFMLGAAGNEIKINTSNSGFLSFGTSLLPQNDNSVDLGSSSKRWANLYTADAHFSNVGTGGNDIDGTEGSWTLQEAEDNIYMINRKNGKRYKIKMEEV